MKPLSRVLTAVLAPLAVLVLAGAPAAAHGGEGEIEITSATRAGVEVTVAVHLKYVEDGHGVPDATVTLVVNEGTPLPMKPGAEEGDYTLTIPAPANAALRVTSVEPATAAEGTAPPLDDTTTPEAGSTTTEAGADTTEAGSDTTEAGSDTTEAATTTEADDAEATTTPSPVPDEAASDDDGGISPIVIGAIVAVVLAAVVMAVILLGKKPSTDEADSTDDTDEA